MNRTTHDQGLADAELVQRAQRGSPSAFAELVSRYQDRVYNTCYRMCHNEVDALDLTQTTFMRALEALGQFRGHARFYTWLFRIAVNLAISQRRSARTRPLRAIDESGEEASGRPAVERTQPSESALLEQRELRDAVERALMQIDEEFRIAVVLKDIEDLDYATIADILDVPIGTVKSRIHRGRLLLRDLLRESVRLDA